jgi:hypothetical protein
MAATIAHSQSSRSLSSATAITVPSILRAHSAKQNTTPPGAAWFTMAAIVAPPLVARQRGRMCSCGDALLPSCEAPTWVGSAAGPDGAKATRRLREHAHGDTAFS